MNLLAVGGEDGITTFWSYDTKEKSLEIPNLSIPYFSSSYDTFGEITSLQFSPDGMKLAIGS